ncbi:MAG TPA: hypothetical protein VFW40_12190 [Capsulimonadaceae bacterium]|nr:hypothetical protein [Capsulimonadaceae bacterium]
MVLDVPTDSPGLGIGVSLSGSGTLRVADVKLEVVGKEVPLSASPYTMQSSMGHSQKSQGKSGANWAAANSQPGNLGFTSNLDGWFQPPASQASASVDPKGGPHGERSLVLIPTTVAGSRWASLQQAFLAGAFRGHRVRLSAMVKAEGIKRGAVMSMGADSPEAYHFARAPMLTGTTGWQSRSVVVDVPADAVGIGINFSVWGAGTLRVADVRLEIVGKDVPLTPQVGER